MSVSVRKSPESEQIDLLCSLIKFGPVYGAEGQRRCVKLLERALVDGGWDEVFTQTYTSDELRDDPNYVPVDSFGVEYADDAQLPKQNVFGIIRGSHPGPTLILNGHYDVEPVTNYGIWKFDWNSGEIRDGKIWGRGSADMLSGLTSVLHVASSLLKGRKDWGGTIIFSAVPDEEIGGNGTLAALRELQSRGLLDDSQSISCLIPEPTSGVIADESLGFLHMILRADGRARHLAGADRSDNGIYKLIDVIQDFDKVMTSISEESATTADRLNYNFGIINGGIDAATPIGQADAEAVIFYPVTMDSDNLKSMLRKYISGIADVNVDFSDFKFAGHKSTPGRLGSVIAETSSSSEIRPGIFSSPCDARLFSAFGIEQVIVYGPGSLEQAHAADEYVDISTIDKYNNHLSVALRKFFAVK